MMVLLLLLALSLFVAPPVCAQQTHGVIDLEKDVKAQIKQLESRLFFGQDEPAHEQVVWLQWLITLYDFVDQKDGVEACYEQILAYFPFDAATMNAYALFLIERRGDYERAEKQLRDAAEWGEHADVRSLDLGTTYELLARVELNQGDIESSIAHARKALELLDEESSAAALRILAESYLQSGAFDEAAEAYLKLIALERGINREDINALQLFVHRTTRYADGSISGLIADAIEGKKRRYRSRIESEGGKIVSFPTEDQVVLEGTLRRTDGDGAALFVPDLGTTRSVYTPYAQLLFIEEISTLSLDLRGHGGSRTDSLPSYTDLTPAHLGLLPTDVVAGFRYLQNETGLADGQIVIAAAGRSCAVVEKAVHQASLAAPVIYLSPTFQSRDRELTNAVFFHPHEPILVVYSAEDLQAMLSFELFSDVKEFSRLERKILTDAGHGIEMLRRDTHALEFFQEWIGKTLGVR
jgi:tetratricopeptide (TPR) repeat protein